MPKPSFKYSRFSFVYDEYLLYHKVVFFITVSRTFSCQAYRNLFYRRKTSFNARYGRRVASLLRSLPAASLPPESREVKNADAFFVYQHAHKSCAGNFALRARCKWRGELRAPRSLQVAHCSDLPLISRKSKNACSVFLLSVRRLSYLILSQMQ